MDMKKTKLTRVSMNLSEKSIRNVEELSELLHESNKTHVVTTAIELALTLIKKVKAGKEIIIKDKNGKEETLKFIGI